MPKVDNITGQPQPEPEYIPVEYQHLYDDNEILDGMDILDQYYEEEYIAPHRDIIITGDMDSDVDE
jgi:hypothetical protein